DSSKERTIRIGGSKNASPDRLRGDGKMRSLSLRMERGHPSKGETILCHGVVNTRAGKRDPVERSESGNDDEQRDSGGASRAEDARHGVGRDARGTGDGVK